MRNGEHMWSLETCVTRPWDGSKTAGSRTFLRSLLRCRKLHYQQAMSVFLGNNKVRTIGSGGLVSVSLAPTDTDLCFHLASSCISQLETSYRCVWIVALDSEHLITLFSINFAKVKQLVSNRVWIQIHIHGGLRSILPLPPDSCCSLDFINEKEEGERLKPSSPPEKPAQQAKKGAETGGSEKHEPSQSPSQARRVCAQPSRAWCREDKGLCGFSQSSCLHRPMMASHCHILKSTQTCKQGKLTRMLQVCF